MATRDGESREFPGSRSQSSGVKHTSLVFVCAWDFHRLPWLCHGAW